MMMDIKKRYAHMLFYYFINLHRQLLQQQRLLCTKRFVLYVKYICIYTNIDI